MYRSSDMSFKPSNIVEQEAEAKMSCCGTTCGPRSFLTREEKVEMLNEYRESLEKELQGVNERIKEVGKES
ncbi:MAG TPA: hypothetical protein VJH88_01890 [Candidatus Nanoarchaeia archaeon]|nr:hypothetical protein [Candidatus Nanoarchaeia archaeon]